LVASNRSTPYSQLTVTNFESGRVDKNMCWTGSLDSGMRRLEESIRSLYGVFRDRGTRRFRDLRNRYRAQVGSPSFAKKRSQTIYPGSNTTLKSDAFIPQSFKIVRYEAGTPSVREDSGMTTHATGFNQFSLELHPTHPTANFNPLCYLRTSRLGSTATEVFAARLCQFPFTPVRVVLRISLQMHASGTRLMNSLLTMLTMVRSGTACGLALAPIRQ